MRTRASGCSRNPVLRCMFLFLVVGAVVAVQSGCGDDEDDESGTVRVERACTDACGVIVGQCNLPAPQGQDCAALCQIGETLAPACSRSYETYVDCTRDRPLVRCDGNDVTVSVALPACLDPLADYLSCAVGTLIPPCLAIPLQDGECVAAGLGAQAYACVGARDGCSLFEGTSRAGGFGLYCCP